MREIVLAPLEPGRPGAVVRGRGSLRTATRGPLAKLVHEKTAGNPFFANQFIAGAGRRGGLIAFDAEHGQWRWDLGSHPGQGLHRNVVDLMVGKLSRLPPATQQALKELACLGNSAEASHARDRSGTSEEELHSDLWEALRLELIVRSEDSYRFVHDRMQEAAYSLISEEQRALAHLRIGRLLAAQIEPDQRTRQSSRSSVSSTGPWRS